MDVLRVRPLTSLKVDRIHDIDGAMFDTYITANPLLQSS